MWPRPRLSRDDTGLDVRRVRGHFDFTRTGRVVTNNAATTQPPRELVDLYRRLVPGYENVHRGQSAASRRTTELFEESYDTIAAWVNAPSRRSIALYRNTTEAINAVMYALLTEFRDGDNVVTTTMEHNSNFVPWYAMCAEILPRFGRRVECRVARFDHATGRLDLDHLAQLVDGVPSSWPARAPRTSSARSRRWTSSGPSAGAAGTGSRRETARPCCSWTPRSSCPRAPSTSRPSTWTSSPSPS